MTYCYIRVSTERQDFGGQLFSVQQYANLRNLHIDEIVEEKISGKVPKTKRDLGKLVAKLNKGDVLVTPELSRLGRSTADTVDTIDVLNRKGIEVHLIKENLVSGTPNYDFMTTIYAGLASMERQRISERTKEALKAKKAQGIQIGHVKGFKCSNVKLTPYQDEIKQLLNDGKSIYYISRKYNVKWQTARDFIRDRLKFNLEKIPSVQNFRSKVLKNNAD